MKTKKITDQIFKTDIIFLIGKKEEIFEFFSKGVFKGNGNLRLRENCKGYTSNDLRKSLETSNGFANRVLFDITTNHNVIVSTVIVDCKRLIEFLKENEKGYKKHLKFVFSHELRHAADIIIDSKKMDFEDKELAANIQGWINSEFEETRDEYFEEELPKMIKEILNEKNEEGN